MLLTISSTMPARQNTSSPAITAEEQMRLDYYLYAALNASEHKKHAQAYFLLEFCYAIDPNNPTVNSMLGAYQTSLYGKEHALPLLRKAYEGSPSDYWYQYVITTYETGNRAGAMKVLKTMQKREPKNIDVLELHEHILMHERKYKQALAIRDKVDALTGEPSLQSVVARHQTYLQMGKDAEALKVLDKYLERNPNEGRVSALRTQIFLREACAKGDRQKGLKLLGELIQNPDLYLSSKLQDINQYTTQLNLTADERKTMLLNLREQYPYELAVYQALMNLESEQGNTTGALDIGRTMLSMNPTDSQLREKIFELMRVDENITPAEINRFIEDSYTLLPDDAKWSYYQAVVMAGNQDYDSVCTILSRAIQHAQEPLTKVQIAILYTQVLMQLNRLEESFPLFEEALKLAPDNTGILNNYAWALAIGGGDLKKAEKMSQRTIQKEANNPTFLDTYAWILHLQGQDTLALFYIKKALEYSEDQSDNTITQHYQIIEASLQSPNL